MGDVLASRRPARCAVISVESHLRLSAGTSHLPTAAIDTTVSSDGRRDSLFITASMPLLMHAALLPVIGVQSVDSFWSLQLPRVQRWTSWVACQCPSQHTRRPSLLSLYLGTTERWPTVLRG